MNEITTLPALASAINRHHDAAQDAARTAIENAIECGRLLLQAKKQVGHGGWLPWLKANTSVSERQSQRYMRVATGAIEGKYDATSDLTIDGALGLLAGPTVKAESVMNGNCLLVPISSCLPNPYWPNEFDCNPRCFAKARKYYNLYPDHLGILFTARRNGEKYEISGPRYRWLAAIAGGAQKVLINNPDQAYCLAPKSEANTGTVQEVLVSRRMVEFSILYELDHYMLEREDIIRAASIAYPYLESIGLAANPDGLFLLYPFCNIDVLKLALSEDGEDIEHSEMLIKNHSFRYIKR